MVENFAIRMDFQKIRLIFIVFASLIYPKWMNPPLKVSFSSTCRLSTDFDLCCHIHCLHIVHSLRNTKGCRSRHSKLAADSNRIGFNRNTAALLSTARPSYRSITPIPPLDTPRPDLPHPLTLPS